MFESILKDKVKFNKKLQIKKECKDLIKQMLEKDPKKRITLFQIMIHPWIKDRLEEVQDNKITKQLTVDEKVKYERKRTFMKMLTKLQTEDEK